MHSAAPAAAAAAERTAIQSRSPLSALAREKETAAPMLFIRLSALPASDSGAAGSVFLPLRMEPAAVICLIVCFFSSAAFAASSSFWLMSRSSFIFCSLYFSITEYSKPSSASLSSPALSANFLIRTLVTPPSISVSSSSSDARKQNTHRVCSRSVNSNPGTVSPAFASCIRILLPARSALYGTRKTSIEPALILYAAVPLSAMQISPFSNRNDFIATVDYALLV